MGTKLKTAIAREFVDYLKMKNTKLQNEAIQLICKDKLLNGN